MAVCHSIMSLSCHSIITFCHAVMAVCHSIVTFCHAIMPVCHLIITFSYFVVMHESTKTLTPPPPEQGGDLEKTLVKSQIIPPLPLGDASLSQNVT